MPEDIVTLLHRRSDLSTFLVHLTRENGGATARSNLISILANRHIGARTCYGMAREWAALDPDVAATQRCVCFSEAPLEHVWMLAKDIEGRQVPLSPYGLAFTKAFGRRKSVNPVWYLDITPGHDWLTGPVNILVELARRGMGQTLATQPPDVTGNVIPVGAPNADPILKLTPFLEQMGPTGAGKKEFWWEREWRRVGDFTFLWSRVVAVLVPYHDQVAFVADLSTASGEAEGDIRSRLRFLDADWGLERMIAALADVDEEDAGPLPHY